jgi:phosphoribosylglycinamide formyltransferase-1
MSEPAPLRLAVMLSGAGRTLANLLDHIRAGRLPASVAVVISNRVGAGGVAIAEAAGIPPVVHPRAGRPVADWSRELFDVSRSFRVDLVVMAGFLERVEIPADFVGRVINIHPSLLPAFGGQGFHGLHVHRAVLDRGCTVSGCTVHLVDDEYDHGRILLQQAVPVLPGDTPESLAARVFAAECASLPAAIAAIAASRSHPHPEASSCTAPSAT